MNHVLTLHYLLLLLKTNEKTQVSSGCHNCAITNDPCMTRASIRDSTQNLDDV